nr:hypothetical transcript [Hymenolepis microstoma]
MLEGIRSTRTRQGAPTADLCVVEWACRVNSVGAHGDDENDDNGEDGARRGIRSTRTRQGAPTADLCVVEWACRVNSVGAHGDDENDDNGEDGARRGELIAIISHLYFLSSFSPSLPDASVDSRTFQTPKYTKEGRAGS